MPIQYSNPEARNLSVTSIAFIAYYAAGGSFINGVVNLSVINARFEHPLVLGYMAWFMLGWFLYRYWVTHHGMFSDAFWSEIKEYKTSPKIRDYAASKLTGGDQPLLQLVKSPSFKKEEEEGWHITDISRLGGDVYIYCDHAKNVKRTEVGEIESYSCESPFFGSNLRPKLNPKHRINAQTTVGFDGMKDRYVWWGICIKYFFEKRTFTDYLTPYILFSIAISAFLWSTLSQADWSTVTNLCFLKDWLTDCTTEYIGRCYLCP